MIRIAYAVVYEMRGISVERCIYSVHPLVYFYTFTRLVVQIEQVGQPLRIIVPANVIYNYITQRGVALFVYMCIMYMYYVWFRV